MFQRFLKIFALSAILSGIFVSAARAAYDHVGLNQPYIAPTDDSDAFFDDSYVHEIHLTFDSADFGTKGWYATLYDSHANNPDDPYFPADFSGDGVSITDVGVRFKGSSSFSAPGVKKSFKIDFDEYDEDNDALVFYSLEKAQFEQRLQRPHDVAGETVP